MSEQARFIDRQKEFTSHIRDPEKNVAPAGVEDRRMAIYRELFYNNVEDFLANSFPVIRELTQDGHWHAMVRDYFSGHIAHTPLFPQMPAEFVDYLQHERNNKNDPPFLLELAHYEWMELAVGISEEAPAWHTIDRDGDLMQGHPVVSPLAIPLSYQFPVHKIGVDFQPQTPGETATHIVVYRDDCDDVHFLEVNAASMRLLQILTERKVTGEQALAQIAEEMSHPNPEVVINGGIDLLNDLRNKQIILGIRAPG